MGSFSSLATAVSGMQAAQLGLAVTGHNMSNTEITGYARQRIIQKEAAYKKLGETPSGALRVGLGTDTGAVHQIRNQFLDLTYRTETGRLNFYTIKSIAGAEIEGLLGELQGDYRFQDVVNDLWYSLQELSKHPDGIETRYTFMATCEAFITKANEVYNSLFEYQHNLDEQIREAVNGEEGINAMVSRIKELNAIISAGEASGDIANDYRDERNRCLDRLSALIPIEYSEDSAGNVVIFSEGHQLLSQNSQNYMGLKFISGDYAFVEPVFTSSKTILPADSPPSDFESYLNFNKPVESKYNNDFGILKGLIIARGAIPAYYNGKDALADPNLLKPSKPLNPVNLPPITDPEYPDYKAAYPDTNTAFKWADYEAGLAVKDDFLQDPDMQNEYKIKLADYYDKMGKYEAAVYNTKFYEWSIDNCLIPRTMVALDSIVNSIVTLINDTVAPVLNGAKDPNAPYDLHGNQSYVEIFVRNNVDRFTGDKYNDVVKGDYYSQYSIGNLSINPQLIDTDGGYNYMAFSLTGDREDQSLIMGLLDDWNSSDSAYAININGLNYNIQDAYSKFVTQLGVEFQEANNFVTAQTLQVTQAENKRNSVMGVSMDEEMSNMMKYQYAYNAASRILNVIDSMLDKIINGMLG